MWRLPANACGAPRQPGRRLRRRLRAAGSTRYARDLSMPSVVSTITTASNTHTSITIPRSRGARTSGTDRRREVTVSELILGEIQVDAVVGDGGD